jgi:hypothetical protein
MKILKNLTKKLEAWAVALVIKHPYLLKEGDALTKKAELTYRAHALRLKLRDVEEQLAKEDPNSPAYEVAAEILELCEARLSIEIVNK